MWDDSAASSLDVSVDGEVSRLRRELQWLRAENARLARLLQLCGLDTTPAPEQLAVPAAAPGLVTMSSAVRDKLAMFADRFHAYSSCGAGCGTGSAA
ncbi:hypothetical protein [Dactylosporangium sp. CA-139066]|uniref:hypothetical protein n=1 Tax=Dactylosporangium sp. CA-139066 TaxID=3239930 RepID=UPI003D8DF5DE